MKKEYISNPFEVHGGIGQLVARKKITHPCATLGKSVTHKLVDVVRSSRDFLIVMNESNPQAVSFGSRGNTFRSFPIPQERAGSHIRIAGKMLGCVFHIDYEAGTSAPLPPPLLTPRPE